MYTPDKILVSAAEAASMLSIGRSTFFRKVAEGLLPQPVRIGGVIRWRIDELRTVGQANPPTTASAPGVAVDTARDCMPHEPH